MEVVLNPKLPEETHMVTAYTPRRARLFREMEQSARALIEAARQRGEVTTGSPPHKMRQWGRETAERNEWFEAVFDMSERELIEAANAAVRKYRAARVRPWQRRETFRAYVRLHTMLGVSKGLTTGWQ